MMSRRRLLLKRKVDSVTSFRVNPQGPAKKIKTPLSTLQDVSDTTFEPSTTMPGNVDDIDANTGEIEDNDLSLAGSESDALVQRTFKDRKDKEAEQWASIRSTLLNAAIEQSGMHFESLCSICLKTPVNIRCQSCGPSVYYCSECLEKSHEWCNQTHSPEVYQVRSTTTSI